jgi:hypothetical protein
MLVMVLNLPSLIDFARQEEGYGQRAIKHDGRSKPEPTGVVRRASALAPQSQPVAPAPRLEALSRRRWLSGLG